MPFQAGEHFPQIHGLGQEGQTPDQALARADFFVGHRCGQKHDGHAFQAGTGRELAGQLPPVKPRHHYVQQDQVGVTIHGIFS